MPDLEKLEGGARRKPVSKAKKPSSRKSSSRKSGGLTPIEAATVPLAFYALREFLVNRKSGSGSPSPRTPALRGGAYPNMDAVVQDDVDELDLDAIFPGAKMLDAKPAGPVVTPAVPVSVKPAAVASAKPASARPASAKPASARPASGSASASGSSKVAPTMPSPPSLLVGGKGKSGKGKKACKK